LFSQSTQHGEPTHFKNFDLHWLTLIKLVNLSPHKSFTKETHLLKQTIKREIFQIVIKTNCKRQKKTKNKNNNIIIYKQNNHKIAEKKREMDK